jgi:uncharacterized RDD family membrane protein YckC
MEEGTRPESGAVFPAESTHHSVRRYIAHAADGVLIGIIFVVFLIPASIGPSAVLFGVVIAGFTLLPFAYYVLTQRRTGQSPGKAMMGLRIVDSGGRPPTTTAAGPCLC